MEISRREASSVWKRDKREKIRNNRSIGLWLVFITIFNASNTFYPLQMILKLSNKNTCSFSVVSFLIKKLNDMSYNTLW
jgi:hypothetical protein